MTDESLIDSYIYEIIALQKKYEYFLRAAKKMGLTNGVQRRAWETNPFPKWNPQSEFTSDEENSEFQGF